MYISLDADVSIANVLVIASIYMLFLTSVVPTKKFYKLLIIKQKNPAITGRVWGLLLLDLNQRPSD